MVNDKNAVRIIPDMRTQVSIVILPITRKVPDAGSLATRIQLPRHCFSFRSVQRHEDIYLYLGEILHLFYETPR